MLSQYIICPLNRYRMSVRLILQFVTPFRVGDTVYLAYPPNQKAVTGSVHEIKPLKATISAIKIAFGQTEELIIKEPVDSYEVKVAHVAYTLIPLPPHQVSPFTINCADTDAAPRLYATEEAFDNQLVLDK